MSRLKDAFMTIEEKYHSLKVQFVQTLPKLLAFNQWNNKLLADTEEECGFVKGYCHIIFPGGIREIVDFFENWQDQNMLDLLSQQETPIKIRDKIDLALRIRIKNCIANPTNITPNSQTSLREATLVATKQSKKATINGLLRRLTPPRNDASLLELNTNQVSYINSKLVHLRNRSYFTTPSNSIFATKIAFRTCDLIWRYAGDKSIDYNYYTKRGLLLSVYITSILYYIQDESENNVDTDQYITKSLSNIITMTSKCKNMLKLPNPVDIPIIRLFS
ncbi:MAG: COQ9 family protein [Rickettsia endosymbiont of Sergentomyia squamirostris]|uniref:COQ9 family protein n=1 Tax=Candidatus Tisiphia endosymbiont of Sergentomyia squamirostris TaxID=3113639 RepID=A0AAT9G9E1_9RICK